MWLNKYKPKTFEDYKYHRDNIRILKNTILDLKNIIFYGPPGTGKTTLSQIILNTIFEDLKSRKNNTMILNASDERGIRVVKTKIKDFCKKNIVGKNKTKFIILDEADMLTYEAQTALRKIMEDYKNTKFILICNYEDKIINPINSRCLRLYFPKINNEYIKNFLSEIIEKENIVLKNQNLLNDIIDISGGDFRKSITLLQSLYNVDYVNKDKLMNVIGYIPESDIRDFLSKLNKKNIFEMIKLFEIKSYSLKDFIEIYKNIILTNDFTDDKKCKIFINLSTYDNLIYYNVNRKIILLNIFKDYLN